MTKLTTIDKLHQVRRHLTCLQQIFLLISNQSEPLPPGVFGGLSYLLEDLVRRLQRIEKAIERFNVVELLIYRLIVPTVSVGT